MKYIDNHHRITEAIQWTGTNHKEVFDFLTYGITIDHFICYKFSFTKLDQPQGILDITCREETLHVEIGDYIVKDTNKTIFLSKPDSFERVFKPVWEDTKILVPKNITFLKDINVIGLKFNKEQVLWFPHESNSYGIDNDSIGWYPISCELIPLPIDEAPIKGEFYCRQSSDFDPTILRSYVLYLGDNEYVHIENRDPITRSMDHQKLYHVVPL